MGKACKKYLNKKYVRYEFYFIFVSYKITVLISEFSLPSISLCSFKKTSKKRAADKNKNNCY